jgi:hypothetical protein
VEIQRLTASAMAWPRQQVTPKCPYICSKLHGLTYQSIIIFMFAAERTSHPSMMLLLYHNKSVCAPCWYWQEVKGESKWSSGICGGTKWRWAGFLRVLRFPLQSSFAPPITPQSPSRIIRGQCTIGQICGRSTGAYTNLGDLQRDLMGVKSHPTK